LRPYSTKPEAPLVAIVDDDVSVRQSARRLVRSLGYRSEAFGSAEEFLESDVISEAACLIADVRMPRMGGLELQRRVAGRKPSMPIVFITALATEDEQRRALRAGAVAFLRKPFDTQVLLAVLRKALGESIKEGGSSDHQ
jgi:FixJ family two-component response regulator